MLMQSVSVECPATAAMLLDAWDRGDMAALASYADTSEASTGTGGCSSLEAERRDLLNGIAVALRPYSAARASSAEAEACLHLLRHLARSTSRAA